MKKALFILGELNDADVDWMLTTGRREELTAGESLIHKGQPINALYILLEGRLAVVLETAEGDREVAVLTSGEVVGEISFVDSRPPSATVKALESCLVWAIPRDRLLQKLDLDLAFASRFYRALAMFLSDRLRGTVTRLGYGKDPLPEVPFEELSLNPHFLDSLETARARFDWLLRRLRASE